MTNYLIEEDDPLYPQYRAAVTNALFAACINMPNDLSCSWFGPGIGRIETLVGYDPQKLLPAPTWTHFPKQWDAAYLKAILDTNYPNYTTDFFPKMHPPKRFYIDGGHFDMQMPGTFGPDEDIIFETPTFRRKLAPFVTPIRIKNVRLSYPSIREPETWRFKRAVVAVPIHADYSVIEARILASMADPRVVGITLDLDSRGGEIEGRRFWPIIQPHPKKVATKPPPSYLKHDPSKKHKRPK